MTYADTLLTEGEVVARRARQHWLAVIARTRLGWLLWIVAIALFIGIVWFNVGAGMVRDVTSVGAIVLVLLGLVIIAYRFWQWRTQEYIITNRRLIKVAGIVNKRSADSSLEKINDAILFQPLLGRMLNFGNLEILTAAEQAVDKFYMLNDPKEFKKTMLAQKHQLETEFMYGQPPSPPLRAEQPMVPPPAPVPQPAPVAAPAPPPSTDVAAATTASAAAPVAEPAPVTEQPDESLEVTQTLARLADLRDSGAITAEEYEQKKDELLGRL